MNNKKIFITGGAGYLGQALIKRYYDNNEITIYSRDESKHYYLKKRYPNLRFIIGDIRDYDNLKKASIGHSIGIFAASMKQIEAVDQNIVEGIKTIVTGGINSKIVAMENGMDAACFISTDKSRAATTLYGSMKFIAGESFIIKNNSEVDYQTKLSTAIYGNVLNSTGSIIPLIWDAILNNYSLKLYSQEMTRFIITADQAIDVIETSLKYDGVNVIPKIPSFKISDLFEIFAEHFSLKFSIGTPRISEKIHEVLISKEEISRTRFVEQDNVYLMSGQTITTAENNLREDWMNQEFSSEFCTISKDNLLEFLGENNFYRPN
jgi:UDP-glucose 4-epimerase